MDNEGTPVVIDNGSYMLKAGFSGDDGPTASIPSSSPRYDANYFNGYNSIVDSGTAYYMSLSRRPIQDGIVDNWDDMTKIWNYCF
jgi:actin